MNGKSVGIISLQEPLFWKVYVDGTANQRGSRVGLVLVSPEQIIIEKLLRLGFSTTNSEAEYEAMLEGMSMVQRMGGKIVEMFSDSKSVVSQVTGEFKAEDERMRGYLSQVRSLALSLSTYCISLKVKTHMLVP